MYNNEEDEKEYPDAQPAKDLRPNGKPKREQNKTATNSNKQKCKWDNSRDRGD